jgi:hypothetical protein
MPTNVGSDEWYEGDRVWVPRITTNESVELRLFKFLGDDDNPDPDVSLTYKEWAPVKGSAIKKELIRSSMRIAKFSELQEVPTKRTKGGAVRRQARGMATKMCECGCGQETSGGMFRQGHDAKLKSKLRKIVDGRLEGDPAEATAELEKRGWL